MARGAPLPSGASSDVFYFDEFMEAGAHLSNTISRALEPLMLEAVTTNKRLHRLEHIITGLSKRLDGETPQRFWPGLSIQGTSPSEVQSRTRDSERASAKTTRASTLEAENSAASKAVETAKEARDEMKANTADLARVPEEAATFEEVVDQAQAAAAEAEAACATGAETEIAEEQSKAQPVDGSGYRPAAREELEAAVCNALLPFEVRVDASLERIERYIDREDKDKKGRSERRKACVMNSPGRVVKPCPEQGRPKSIADKWGCMTMANQRRLDSSVCGIKTEDMMHGADQLGSGFQRSMLMSLVVLKEWYDLLEEPERKGCLASVVTSKTFEGFCSAVIVVNAFVVVYTTNARMEQWNAYPDDSWIVTVEFLFLGFYLVELLLKVIVHRLYFFHGPDVRWNIFDACLVFAACWDQASLSREARSSAATPLALPVLRIMRLSRVLRVLRIMRLCSDLRLMMNSIMGSLSSLFWSFVMLAFCFYMFGLMLVVGMTGYLTESGGSLSPKDVESLMASFGTVQDTMLSLFKASTNGVDWDAYFQLIALTGTWNTAGFVMFMGFIHISLLNILTAVFVDHAMKIGQPDSLVKAREEQLKIRAETEDLRQLVYSMDQDGSGTISRQEFRLHMSDGRFRSHLAVLGLDVRDAHTFFELLIADRSEVEIDAFVEGCMRMRGHATGIDQHTMICEVRALARNQKQYFAYHQYRFDELSQMLLSAT